MATQVGDGFIEVDVRINNRNLRDLHQRMTTQFRQMGDRAGAQFTQAFNRNLKVSRLRVEVDRDHLRNSNMRVRREMTGEGMLWGSMLGRHLAAGISGVLSLLPSRLEMLFTKTGPIIGTALVAGLAGAIAIGLPAIGAMAAGLFFAGFGFAGALAAVVVGAVNDPRVSQAWTRLGDSFKRNVINHPDVQRLGQVLADQLDKVGKAIERWGPHIRSILNAGAKFVPIITNSIIGFVDAVLPAFDRMMNSPFVADLMKIAAEGIVKMGEALGISFDRFLQDPAAMEGAKMGLEDFFNLLASGIKTIMDFIRWLSKMWFNLNNPDESGKSPLDKMRDVWKAIKDTADDVVIIIKDILDELNRAFGPGSEFEKATGAWDNMKNDALEFLTVLRDVLSAMAGTDANPNAQGSQFGTGNTPYGNVGQNGEDRNGDAEGFGQQQGGLDAWLDNQWEDIKAEAKIAWSTIKQHIKDAWEDIKNEASTAWTNIKNQLSAKWGEIKQTFTQELEIWKARWNSTWGWIKDTAQGIWNSIFQNLSSWINNIQGWFNNGLNAIKTGWNNAWGYVKQRAQDWWNNITSLLSGWWTNIQNWFRNGLTWVKEAWNNSWQWVKDRAAGIWNSILNTVKGWWTNIQNWFRNALNWVKEAWNNSWQWVKDRAAGIWNAIWNTLKGWWNGLSRWFQDRLQDVRELWNFIWDRIRQKAREIWEAISAKIGEVVAHIRAWLGEQFDKIRKAWDDLWNGVHKFFEKIWEKIRGAAQVGINWVLGVIQKGIDIINGALAKLKVDFRIPSVLSNAPSKQASGRQGGGRGFATGGMVRGPGTTTSDSIPAYLSRNEFVVNAKSAKRIGYSNLDYMNQTGGMPWMPGFASGGRVGAGNNQLLNEHRNHVHVAMMQGWQYVVALAKKAGFKVNPTSTYRPGDPLWHGKGKAVDFGGYNQDALAAFFMRVPGVMELIHRTGKRDYAIFGGKAGAGGAGLGGIFEWLGKGWDWVKEHILQPAGNKAIDLFGGGNQDFFHAFGHGSIKGIFGAILGKSKDEFDKAEKELANMGTAGGGGGATQWTGVASMALKMLGLPKSWLGPLLTLIGRESGGNPRAVNRTDSNAAKGTPSMGLMQTIGPTFNAYHYPGRTNILAPLDNILAGLRYIKARYGSIFNVQQAVGSTPRGYDNGGILGPGQVGINMSRHPEMMLNNAQGAALEKRIAGEGDGLTDIQVEVNIHEDYYEAVLRRKGEVLSRQLKAGKRVYR